MDSLMVGDGWLKMGSELSHETKCCDFYVVLEIFKICRRHHELLTANNNGDETGE
jgi:hypothetical protein